MTLTFDQATYADLLMEMTPKVIETEAEYEKVLVEVEALAFNQNRTTEETALYKLLVLLAEAYEAENYSMKEVSPTEVLTHILEASDFTAADLVGLLGSSDVVSEVLEGKQAITKVQAQILGDRFKVSPSLFID
ncbi:MAG: transcriptional regulator [Cyanobacteria bacterium P01_D01_bin.6]